MTDESSIISIPVELHKVNGHYVITQKSALYLMTGPQVTSTMQSVVASIASATRRMNLQSLAVTMDRFEQMTDSLSSSQNYVSESLGRDGGQSAAADQARRLMAQIVDRVELDARNGMPAPETSLAACGNSDAPTG